MALGESGGRTSPSERRSAEEEEGGEVGLLPLESAVRGDVTVFGHGETAIPGLCVGVCAAKMSAATESSFRLALKKPPALRTTEVNKTIFPHRASFSVR